MWRIWRLTQIVAPTEIPARRFPTHDVDGLRSGIQEFRGPVPAQASSLCPICTQDVPHHHGMDELQTIRQMETYLSSKLGVASTQVKP